MREKDYGFKIVIIYLYIKSAEYVFGIWDNYNFNEWPISIHHHEVLERAEYWFNDESQDPQYLGSCSLKKEATFVLATILFYFYP